MYGNLKRGIFQFYIIKVMKNKKGLFAPFFYDKGYNILTFAKNNCRIIMKKCESMSRRENGKGRLF